MIVDKQLNDKERLIAAQENQTLMNSIENLISYLDIPGEKQLIYTFKFNMDLPAPVPQPKTMFVPLDPERYVKPKLTLLHVKRKPVIFTDINLNIPIDEINMKPELYNPAADANIQLTAKDRELLEERVPQDLKKKKTPQKGTLEAAAAPGAAKENNGAHAKPETPVQAKKTEPSSASKKKEEPKKLNYNDFIKKSFEIAKTYNTDFKHSSKEGLTCTSVLNVLPDIENLITDMFIVKTEVATDTLKSKENVLRFDIDTDKKPVLGIFTKTSLFGSDADQELRKKKTDEMEEEVEGERKEPEISPELANDPLFKKLENFTFVGNYIYSNPKPQGTAKKDLLLNLRQSDGTTFVYPTQPLVIKKKKAMFVNKPTISNKDDDQEEERRPKEVHKSIKILRKKQDKEDLLLRKRRYEELNLKKTSFNEKNKELLDNYKEEEDEEELERLKKIFIKEEEEEEEVEVPEEGGSEAVEEEEIGGGEGEGEAEMEEKEDNQSRDVNSERDVDEGEEEYKGAGSEAAPEEENKMAEEEEEVPEPVTEKPAATEDKISTFKRPKSDSEDDRVNEISKFFESSDEDSD